MANPLYNDLYKMQNVNPELSAFVQNLNQFKQSFRGNPRDEVQRLLNSGQMSQDQFNQLSRMTNQIMQMMK